MGGAQFLGPGVGVGEIGLPSPILSRYQVTNDSLHQCLLLAWLMHASLQVEGAWTSCAELLLIQPSFS